MTNCEEYGHYCPNCDRSFSDTDKRIRELESSLQAMETNWKRLHEFYGLREFSVEKLVAEIELERTARQKLPTY